ncbi:hypothetical protein DM992_39965 (plasmid) [Burkholderia sp. JP2-270]|nr:hypothetical protein DM992_39965 [Burkholderia sp. JP2-270]
MEHHTFRIACGQTVDELVATLGASSKTVSTDRTNIVGKMGLRGQVDLVRYAIVSRTRRGGDLRKCIEQLQPHHWRGGSRCYGGCVLM